ncbi:O-succinylbenzoate synthase [Fodinibius sediminis]|uniref:o-succinylbenzoate synthase n=1 Tax=Fodinibius sediminis TaxID=1214077 RepID=A0A521DAQ5_9BACT|nr:O-succinylbenzoate synthase [Fodinibius sediminis]
MKNSGRIYYERKGIIFVLSSSGKKYYGEAAPLPGFSNETFEQLAPVVTSQHQQWLNMLSSPSPLKQLQNYYKARETAPSLQFALDSVATQLEAQQAGKKISTFLFGHTHSKITVNGLVPLLQEASPITAIQELTRDGFNTVKCKVGRNFKREYEQLTRIRYLFPDLRIRVDANRAWTLEEAATRLKTLEPIGIEYCEEPLRHPSPSAYDKLRRETSVPLALDESVNIEPNWADLLDSCSILILKPMVIGSFSTLFTIRQQARATGCKIVFTSSLESSIGRMITAALALGMGASDYAHGLATGSVLSEDFASNLPNIHSGSIRADELDFGTINPTLIASKAKTIR